MPTTTRGALPYPTLDGSGPDDVPADLEALAARIAAVGAMYLPPGVAADRPAASTALAGYLRASTDTGAVDYCTGAGWLTLNGKKTIRIPHTFTISGEVKVNAAGESYIPPFPVPAPAGQTSALAAVRVRLNSGTSVTCELRKNGTIIGTAFTVSSATWATVARTTTFADLDDLALVVTAVSGTPKGLSVAPLIDYGV